MSCDRNPATLRDRELTSRLLAAASSLCRHDQPVVERRVAVQRREAGCQAGRGQLRAQRRRRRDSTAGAACIQPIRLARRSVMRLVRPRGCRRPGRCGSPGARRASSMRDRRRRSGAAGRRQRGTAARRGSRRCRGARADRAARSTTSKLASASPVFAATSWRACDLGRVVVDAAIGQRLAVQAQRVRQQAQAAAEVEHRRVAAAQRLSTPGYSGSLPSLARRVVVVVAIAERLPRQEGAGDAAWRWRGRTAACGQAVHRRASPAAWRARPAMPAASIRAYIAAEGCRPSSASIAGLGAARAADRR